MDISELENDIMEFAKKDLEDKKRDAVSKSRQIVNEGFSQFSKMPIDTGLLALSTEIKTNGEDIDIVVNPATYTEEIQAFSKYSGYKTGSTTIESAQAVIYALGASSKYGRRDFVKETENEMYNQIFKN